MVEQLALNQLMRVRFPHDPPWNILPLLYTNKPRSQWRGLLCVSKKNEGEHGLCSPPRPSGVVFFYSPDRDTLFPGRGPFLGGPHYLCRTAKCSSAADEMTPYHGLGPHALSRRWSVRFRVYPRPMRNVRNGDPTTMLHGRGIFKPP